MSKIVILRSILPVTVDVIWKRVLYLATSKRVGAFMFTPILPRSFLKRSQIMIFSARFFLSYLSLKPPNRLEKTFSLGHVPFIGFVRIFSPCFYISWIGDRLIV